jgi:excisionase family DNA binding protein
LSVGETAARLGISVDKVRDLADAGELPAQRTAGGHRRFSRAAVERYATQGARRKRTAAPNRPRSRSPVLADFDDDIEEMPAELEWEEPDYPPAHPAAPVPVSGPPTAPPPSVQHQGRIGEEERRRKAGAEAARLQNLKTLGMASIPYDVPPIIRGKIVSELESYVIASHLPEWIPTYQQQELVRARVTGIVEGFRKEATAEADRKKAEVERQAATASTKAEAERWRQQLIEHGKRYAWEGLQEFESLVERWGVEAEIDQELQRQVRADWSERDVECLVDDVLEDETANN